MLSNYQDHKVVLQEEEAFVVEHYMYTPRGVYIELHAVYGFCSAKKIAIFLFIDERKAEYCTSQRPCDFRWS